MKKSTLFILIAVIAGLSLRAQWPTDPNENLAISTADGEQAISKIATADDGTTYVSWFSNATGNYNVRLQRFDVDGNKQWGEEGILVSDHPAMSWLTDYDMTVDHTGCAIIVFQDIRNGDNDVFAYRIDPSGEFLWGEDGLELSSGPAFDVSPKVTVTGSNDAVVAWAANYDIVRQKISPEGELLWGEEGITMSGDNTFSWPQLMPVGDDDVIMKFFEDEGPSWAPDRYVYAQRYDDSGNAVWEEDAVISDATGISSWTQVFPMVSDGQDGFYIAWHDDRDEDMLSSVFVQHVNAQGEMLFTDNGVEASTQANRNNFYAQLALPTGSEDIYVFWNEMDGSQNNRGIYGQKIAVDGSRLWGSSGKTFIELSSTDVLPFGARSSQEEMVVFYEEAFNSNAYGIKAMRIDTEGEFVWAEEKVPMCSVESGKVHPVVNHFNNGQWIATWDDSRNASVDIYGQNINLDGSLGGSGSNLNAQFQANDTMINEGGSVSFTDQSTGGPTSWEWSFEGGTPETSTEQNPTVTYNTGGAYDVTLTVYNTSDSSTLTKSNYIQVNPDQDHWEFWGGTADPIWTIYMYSATLDGIDLEYGDELAIFDGDGLVGQLFIEESFDPGNVFDQMIIAWSNTYQGSTYTPGNPVILKCWDVSEQAEYEYANVGFSNPYGDAWMEEVFPPGDGQYSMIDIAFESGGEQQIVLNDGYSFASSYIIPFNPDMINLCGDLISDETLDFARNSDGNMLQKIGPEWVNGIGDWQTNEGYLFKMNADDELLINGNYISDNTTQALEAGYTFISYLPHAPMDALEASEQILENLDFMRDSEGNSLLQIGSEWVNNIGNLEPGQGYLVSMDGADSLFYPSNASEAKSLLRDDSDYYHFKGGNPADPVYTMYLVPGDVIEAGDEVAAWAGDKLLGSTKLTGSNALENDLAVFSTLLEGKGYKAGDPIRLSLYDASQEREFELDVEMLDQYAEGYTGTTYPKGDGKFSMARITKSEEAEDALQMLELYPNPTSNKVHISAPDVIELLRIYDHSGKLIDEKANTDNSISIDVNGFESGIYLFRIVTGKRVLERKVIVQ
ncbi:MAG: T9SS type A sorting domain-containing protein [Bacteroidales bacterium]|nr:T9SS type A sorting domain-containing protein [Bacteroidales bacterium]